MVINPALLRGQAKDYLEDTLNLDSCACQTNIRAKLPEKGIYQEDPEGQRNILTKNKDLSPWYCRENAAIAAFPRQ